MKAAELRDPVVTAAYLDTASMTVFYALEHSEGVLGVVDAAWLLDVACKINEMAVRLTGEEFE